MGVFDSSIQTALELIEEYGQKVIWRKILDDEKATGKPWKSDKPGPSVDVPNISICFLPVDRVNSQLLRYLAKTDIVIGSLYGLMAGNVPFEPSPKDIVIRDGKELKVTALDLLSPNGQKVLYTVQFDS